MAASSGPAGTVTTAIPYANQPTDVQRTKSAEAAVGLGSLANQGPLPEAKGATVRNAVLGSLRDIMPDISGGDADVKLFQILSSMKDMIGSTEEAKIRLDQETKRLANQEKQAKADEAEKKRSEAAEKREKLSTWDKVKLAFQYIGAITAIVGGIVMCATGAGAVAGAMMIAGGVIMLGMAVDATLQTATAKDGKQGLGMLGLMVKADNMAKGMSEEEATKKAKEADRIGHIVASVVAAVLMLGGVAINIAGSTATLANTIIGVSEKAVSTGVRIAGNVNTAMGIAGTLGNSSGDIYVAKTTRDMANIEAGSTKLKGEAKQIEALISAIDDMIDMQLARLKGALERFEASLDSLTAAVQDRGNSLSRVAFKA